MQDKTGRELSRADQAEINRMNAENLEAANKRTSNPAPRFNWEWA